MESKVWSSNINGWRWGCTNMRAETPINVNTGGRAEVMQVKVFFLQAGLDMALWFDLLTRFFELVGVFIPLTV